MTQQKKTRALSRAQKEEIARRYIAGRAQAGAPAIELAELAQEYGVTQETIGRILDSPEVIEGARRRTRAGMLLAQAMAEEAAPRIMEATIRSALGGEPPDRIVQSDRRDVLDRAGVRARKEEAQDVTISFSGGGFALGMPEGGAGE